MNHEQLKKRMDLLETELASDGITLDVLITEGEEDSSFLHLFYREGMTPTQIFCTLLPFVTHQLEIASVEEYQEMQAILNDGLDIVEKARQAKDSLDNATT